MQGRAAVRRQVAVEGAGEVEHLLARVKAAGLKMTPQRMAIVREVAGDESHPSAQELFDRLRPGMPTMSFATVYNTLTALCAAGLGTSLSLAPGSARFDPNMHPHDHLVCDRCGAVRDIPESTPSRAAAPTRQTLAKAAPGFELRVVEQIFRGVCVDCAGRPPSASGNNQGDDDDQKQSRRPSAKRKDHRS
jgi:Fe2+ or Zn2+ uptake regulation protein